MRRQISCWSAKVVITLSIGLAWAGGNAQCVADSVADFSGVQGQNGWYYGYYDRDGDSDRTYNAATDFQLLPEYSASWESWYIQDGVFWTGIWNDGMHPNGRTTSGGRQSREHWAVRRWVSSVAGNFVIRGHVAKHPHSTCCGDGTVVHIYLDGVEVWSGTRDYCDYTGYDYALSVTLQMGSIVDFVLDPNHQSNDWCDGTIFTAQIVSSLAGDVDRSGCVDDADLLQVLFAFGATEPNDADVNCDGVVDDADLLQVLFNFGSEC
ncbi:MAG: hypothetical protein KatS3mg016_1417 [Fimbriimonadales bacterium]|nr:MAG: hypothetical protein KatS3mg016_1417 [Fimbriimonadales bacterium]